MPVVRRVLLVCVLGTMLGGGLLATSASAAAMAEGAMSPETAVSGSPLVTPGAQWLLGVGEQEAVLEARRDSPEAFVDRRASRTKYEGLGVGRIASLAARTFPSLIEQRSGGAPSLPAGQRITGYLSPNVAQLILSKGKRGVIESVGPMARETSRGHFAPLDLGLKRTGEDYAPVSSDVQVQIPARLGDGVKVPGLGVSLTPVDAQGATLGGEGSVDGSSVIYPNTGTDTDTVAKPTSMGFDVSAILRSVDSPRVLYYRVGMPSGASLVQKHPRDPVRVVLDGMSLAMVMPPDAVDAAGTPVPVRMNVRGDVLAVEVEDGSGEFQYPVEVDPEFVTAEDRSLTGGVFPVEEYKGGTNWVPVFSSAFSEATTYKSSYSCGPEDWEWCDQSWYIEPTREYNGSEYAGLEYKTQGQSTVYNLEMWVEGENEPSQTTTEVEYRYGPKNEGRDQHFTLSSGIKQERYKYEPLYLTSGYFHNPLETPRENSVRIMDDTGQHESLYGFWTWIWQARVYVAQEESEHPEVTSTSACKECGFNTTSPTIAEAENRPNVLYGSGGWLSPYSGAYEVTAHDPGIGVSFVAVDGAGMSQQRFIREKIGHCNGIQCPETYKSAVTYLPSMANGEDSIELLAKDAAGLYAYTYATIKVDASKPYKLGFTGMPEEGAEISASPHKLTVHATDGTKPTPSSGVKSIGVSIDGGKETTIPGSACSPGECTASGEYTLDGENLSEGLHRIVVSAVSNAGDSGSKEFVFDVRHSHPVSVGPGTVDPTSGQFTLGATDVSLAGAIGVSRTYQSRNLTAGATGPFGPQWAANLGGGEYLTVLPTGSAVVSSSTGQTTYSLNSKGEFEAPKGDENLKLEYKSAEHKYVLKDATAGSETIFEQPSGTEYTDPTWINQFGSESSELAHPVSDTVDASGNVWVTDFTNDRIVEFSPSGALLGAYGSYGSEAGEMINPWGIAINHSTGDVYVTDQANMRVDEFSSTGTFIDAMGWGVSNGANELQTCTSTCRSGIQGSNPGQFSWLAGITIDSSGNLWIVDNGNDRIEEFNEKQEFLRKFGSVGSGAGQFNGPLNVAFSGGNVYATDQENNRIQEFTIAGAFVKTMGWGVNDGKDEFETCTKECRAGIAGSGNGQYDGPRGIAADPTTGNLYVTEMWSDHVQEITAAGVFTAKFGSSGSGLEQFSSPMGVVVGPNSAIYVTDYEHSRIQEWDRPLWYPTSAKGALSKSATYVYEGVAGIEGTMIEPAEVLSPAPTGVSCGTKPSELKVGCRALTFKYATETTAKGEARSEWGQYKGRLKEVIFHAYNTATKAMAEPSVAHYEYDAKGRLRTEWDPRIAPALKTAYGYDAEGHVTALTPPGQESWAFVYGTLAGDSNAGRLLKVTHAPASASLWNGESAKNTEAPKLSGTPVVGVKMGASHGSWSNGPIEYEYQWEDCNSEGKSCTPILGATNENYKVASSDVGYTLIAQVTTINGGGSVTAASTASVVVSNSGTKTEGTSYSVEPGSTLEYRVPVSGTGLPTLTKEEVEQWGQKDKNEEEDNDPIEGMAVFPPDEPQGWPATDYTRAAIDYLNAKGLTVNTATPTGGISTIEYNDINEITRTLDADNRTTAFKEGCKSVSKKECKSAEIAEKLDTQTEYSPSGNDIVKVLGPEHKIKLANGEEVQARAVSHDYYDESGAKEAEEKNKETYNLLTKTTDGALLANGKEADVRITTTSYNGQNGLGWKLRKPTSTTSEPGLTHTTVYEEATGNVIETRGPESAGTPSYVSQFGVDRGGHRQFNWPEDIAIDGKGNIWVADTYNERVQEFSASGEYLSQFGSWGTGEGQMEYPKSIAIDSKGDVWIVDSGANRVEEFSETGTYIRAFGGEGTDQLKSPEGLALNGKGDVWVVDSGDNRLEEFTEAGVYVKQVGSEGTGNEQFKSPRRIAIDSKGNLWVTDSKNCRVMEFGETGKYEAQFGKCGSGHGEFNEPQGLKVDSAGNIWVTDENNDRVQEFNEKHEFVQTFGTEGTGNGDLVEPEGLALDSKGDVWVIDSGNSRAEEFSSTGVYMSQFGTHGSPLGGLDGPKSVAIDSKGDKWVADTNNSRIVEFSPSGESILSVGSEGTGPGQLEAPRGVAIDSKGDIWVVDQTNDRIEEYESTGKYVREFGGPGKEPGKLEEPQGIAIDKEGNIWVADTGNHRIQEFSNTGTPKTTFGVEGEGRGELKEPKNLAIDANGNIWVSDAWNDKIEEFNTSGSLIGEFGKYGSAPGQFHQPQGIAIDQTGDIWVVDSTNSRIQEFTPSGGYLAQFGTNGSGNGQFNEPRAIALDSAGNAWIADSNNNRIEEWTVATPHAARTVYYSNEANPAIPTCGKHPEWANLPCQTLLGAQPDRGLPELPVATMSYNMWDELETSTEAFGTGAGAVSREKIQTYDAAGRALTSEEKSSPATDTALPKVTNEYNAETGALEKQSTTIAEKLKTITAKENKLGQLVEYTDAEGNVAKYAYEEGSDGRLEEVSEGKGKEAESKQTYSYDPITGFMTKLVDSAAGTFTASYDLEGRMTSEIYPNGMCANTTYNAAGTATSIEYIKTRVCSETGAPVWFSDSIVPSIHGETLEQTSTLSKEEYEYDTAGRLLKTQETPAGKGCVTRVYAYDEESNRTSLTTREPGTEGKCASEGGTVQRHTYDEANRLTDEGVAYETFGNITKMPAADAGGHEITSTYYLDNQLATETQNSETLKYLYDPAGRTMETTAEGKTASKTISHYAGPDNALTWASEGSEKWTRNIPGLDGALDAIQTSGGTIELQLHDLQGNVVGSVNDSESETKLHTTYNSTEFGVPQPGTTPPKYAWLGADGISSEPSTGSGVSTEGGASYVPQVARSLQTAPVIPPGAFPNGPGTGTPYVSVVSPGAQASAAAEAARVFNATEAERQKAREQEAAEALQKCQAEGGCGAEQEDGASQSEEFEFYDPEGLASYHMTRERAEQLRADSLSCDSILLLISEGDADCGSYREQLTASAEDLEKCADNKKSHPWGVCYINEEREEDGLGDSIPWSAEAELCTYVRTIQHENVYYCPGRRADVFGPWF